MKRAFSLAVCMLIAAAPVFAQSENIGVFADPGGTNCNITDGSPGVIPIYVVHMLTPGATASSFSTPLPSCMTGAVWLSDAQVFDVTLGDSQSGVSIGYGSCQSAPIHVLTVSVFGQGLSVACCKFGVFADPNQPSGQIEVVDCGGSLSYAGGVTARVNGDGSCGCEESYRDATWGQVKSIYDE